MHQQEEVAFAVIIGTLLFLFLCVCLLLFFILFQHNKKRHKEEKKSIELAYKNELAHATLEIQENTLHHISKELHDNVGQLLTVAIIHLNSLHRHPEKRTTEKIAETSDVVEIAINEIRNLSKTLNPEKIRQFGLKEALNAEVERLAKFDHFKTELNHNGEWRSLGADIEIIIFRIIQEFVANSIKYAEANIISITLTFSKDEFSLYVRDNGKGFDITKQPSGSGILNMKHRASLIDADCVFDSMEGKGTSLYLKLGGNKEESETTN